MYATDIHLVGTTYPGAIAEEVSNKTGRSVSIKTEYLLAFRVS